MTEIRYTDTGFLVILPQDNPNIIIDYMLKTCYSEEFCLSFDFSSDFIAHLMEAGFLVMSARFGEPTKNEAQGYLLLPKLHLSRSALFFENLHIKKSIKRYLGKYELRPDSDFEYIVERCLEKHGDDWLTSPLVDAIKKIRKEKYYGVNPVSFALYREGRLVAGEFGVMCGKVYTSYSGYYDEDNAGTVQLILSARYLKENGFSFFDLGMPMPYKNDLGALDISPEEFVRLFRDKK